MDAYRRRRLAPPTATDAYPTRQRLSDLPCPGDPPATEDDLPVVEHGRLTGRRRPDWHFGFDDPAAAAVGLVAAGRSHERRNGRRPMADPERRPKPFARGGLTGNEGSTLDRHLARLEILPAGKGDRVRQRVDARHVPRLAEGNAQTLPLTDRVGRCSTVFSDPRSVGVEQGTRFGPPAGALAKGVAIVAGGHEADLLALGLVGGHQTE